jgi:uncharacterized protein (DUF433 family)
MAERIITASDLHKGAGNPMAKLDDERVREIVRAVRAGKAQRTVAQDFGVNFVTVNHIMRGRQWTHVTSKMPEFHLPYDRNAGRPRGEAARDAKLTAADVVTILNRLSAGESNVALAAAFGVHETTISSIKLGITWRHVPRPQGAAHAA